MAEFEGRIAGHPTVRFGNGDQPLVIIPGLSDSLQGDETSRFTRLLLKRYYMRAFADDYDVYIVSRPRELPDDTTTRKLAANYAAVLEEIGQAAVLGMSMGGLIAQYLGSDHPANVQKLVVSLAGPHLSESGAEHVSKWLDSALEGRWSEVYLGSVEATYSSTGARAAYGTLLQLPGVVRQPPYPNDFIASAQACLDHDSTAVLSSIEPETLVLGGELDVLFDADDLRSMGGTIPNATTRILEDTGHGAFEERRTAFTEAITAFLR
ncbi:hydrolase or acyltransferase of alpha/beta superfamily protein [Natronococcus amylolyticus DSM 10524]|uniref:Hydrolase or acyltransferase of alpha/beta superfamily protein n=1 Tax=Natronococcus amylolyticus DSM 10524 TaxID=1227497 RepID=L9XG57_9EURY|nr:alpha/beta hydrolase [Natronococcus amylolyticus]ELY59663.1 hydrolase or acyltransferase of alpha/beta superfamily protein [Natronococcus amylolyticus DSM 10524]